MRVGGYLESKGSARAHRFVSELERATSEYFPGERYYWRAVVAAAAGEKPRAIAILREGVANGMGSTNLAFAGWGTAGWVSLHADPFLASLQSDSAFVALLGERL